jgi:3-hydroxyacyl-[acyl-carrier-protein] dehydratase
VSVELSYQDILKRLPHRYPFLFVDKITDLVPFEKAVGIKNVGFGDPVFQGHFPQDPIFPGVLILEALAQTAAVLALYSLFPEPIDPAPSLYFMTIDEAKFRKPVRPGDSVSLNVYKTLERKNIWKIRGEAFVAAEKAMEASFMSMIRI